MPITPLPLVLVGPQQGAIPSPVIDGKQFAADRPERGIFVFPVPIGGLLFVRDMLQDAAFAVKLCSQDKHLQIIPLGNRYLLDQPPENVLQHTIEPKRHLRVANFSPLNFSGSPAG